MERGRCWIWISPNGTKNEIDYILCSHRRSSVANLVPQDQTCAHCIYINTDLRIVMTEIINNWLHLYSTFLDSQSALHSKGGNLLIHHQCAASTWMMRRQPYCARMPTTHQLFCSSLFLLQKTWCCLLQGTTSPRSFEFFTHTNLSKRLLYMNAGSLASSCESQVFYIWDEDMTAASDEGKPSTPKQDFDFLTLLYIIVSLFYWRPFWRIMLFFLCSVLFWF